MAAVIVGVIATASVSYGVRKYNWTPVLLLAVLAWWVLAILLGIVILLHS